VDEQTLAERLTAAQDAPGQGQRGDKGLETHFNETGFNLLKDN
jgi:hypothetical protein